MFIERFRNSEMADDNNDIIDCKSLNVIGDILTSIESMCKSSLFDLASSHWVKFNTKMSSNDFRNVLSDHTRCKPASEIIQPDSPLPFDVGPLKEIMLNPNGVIINSEQKKTFSCYFVKFVFPRLKKKFQRFPSGLLSKL